MGTKKKKHFVEKLTIGEVSLCGQGANQPAFVSLLKTENPTEVCKQMFSDVMQQMEVSEELRAILNSSWKMGDALYDSFYSILMNPEITEKKSRMIESFNQYIASMMSTITNTDVIKEIKKLTKEKVNMPKELQKKVEILEKQAETNAELMKNFMALASMSDVQKAYHAKLSEEDKAVFIEKSTVEMDTEIEKSTIPEESFVSTDGITINKSEVGEATFAIFKAQDAKIKAQDTTIAKSEEVRINKEYTQRAETEYPNLPGTPEQKGAVLKNIENMTDPIAKEAGLAMLKSGNETNKSVFKEIGAGGEDVRDANEKLKKMAQTKADTDSITFEKAYSLVLETPEGDKLYNEISA